MFEEIETGIAEIKAGLDKASGAGKQKRAPRPRKAFASHLERVEVVIEPEAFTQLPAPFEDEAGEHVLPTRQLRNHRSGLGNGRKNPGPVFVAPSPTALCAGNQCHSSHAAQLTSLIKPT